MNNINTYANKIIKWSNYNYIDGNIIIKFLENLALNYITIGDSIKNNKNIQKSKKLYSNFNKYLIDNTIEEKMILLHYQNVSELMTKTI